MKKSVTIVGALLAASLLSGSASALVINPGRTELRLAPGSRTDVQYTVQNDHDEEMQVDITQKNWFLSEKNKSFAVQDWLGIKGKTYFVLKPGETRQVKVRVHCPKSADGLLVGMTSFAFQPMTFGTVTPMISVSIYVSVAGTEQRTGHIKTLAARVYENQLTVGAEVAADGNVHLRPTGRFQVLDSAGKVIAEHQVKEGDPVFPGQSRGFVSPGLGLKPAPGEYRLQAEFQYGEVAMKAHQAFTVLPNGDIRMVGGPIPG